MAIYAIVSMLAVGCLLLFLVLFRMRKLSTLAGKETDLSPVLNNLDKLQALQVQADRSVHDEFLSQSPGSKRPTRKASVVKS